MTEGNRPSGEAQASLLLHHFIYRSQYKSTVFYHLPLYHISMQPSIKHSIWRGIVAAFSFAIPLIFAANPTWENLTVGSIVFTTLHYFEGRLKKA